MKQIRLDLHKKGNALLLDYNDVYNYVGEAKDEDVRLAIYIQKWCEYLNYYLNGEHNDEMPFGDIGYERLSNWIDGYNFSKNYRVDWDVGEVKITADDYIITLKIPFEI